MSIGVGDLVQPLFEQGALGRVGGQAERLLVGAARVGFAADVAHQLGPGRMEQVIAAELLGERVDLGERGGGPEYFGEGDGTV